MNGIVLTEEQQTIREAKLWWVSTYSHSVMKFSDDSASSDDATPNILKGLQRTIDEFLRGDSQIDDVIHSYIRFQKSILRFEAEIKLTEVFSDLEKDEYAGILMATRQNVREIVIEKTGADIPVIDPDDPPQ